MLFSKTTRGFYDRSIHGDNVPPDAVEISKEQHAALLEAQASGQLIEADANGLPVAVDRVQTAEEVATAARAERDSRINAVAWRYERYAREVRLGLTPTDDIAALDAYVQALADVPAQKGFPTKIKWPTI